MDSNLRSWVWLANLKGMITRKKVELLQIFDNADEVYAADTIALAQTGILSRDNIQALLSKDARNAVDQTMEQLVLNQIRVITLADPAYPQLLKNICDPPVVLYVKGKLPNDIPAVAVVGSRKASGYGISAAKKLSSELAHHQISVVSGMARGIDTAAHQGALAAGGKTVAVFGCGLDIIYPPENRILMGKITENGAVVSEYPPQTQPAPHHFPVRNRIVSGMSVGVLVIEASEKSGSLITAQMALEQGRDVYALPGNVISLNSRGTNKLIQDGAKLVTTVQDILDEVFCYHQFQNTSVLDLDIYRSKMNMLAALDNDEQSILEMLSVEPLHIDELQNKLRCEMPLLHRLLLSLEMKGLIRRETGGKYCIEA